MPRQPAEGHHRLHRVVSTRAAEVTLSFLTAVFFSQGLQHATVVHKSPTEANWPSYLADLPPSSCAQPLCPVPSLDTVEHTRHVYIVILIRKLQQLCYCCDPSLAARITVE